MVQEVQDSGGAGSGRRYQGSGLTPRSQRPGWGFRAQDSGSGVKKSRMTNDGLRVKCAGFRACGSGFRVQVAGFRVEGSECIVVIRLRVQGSRATWTSRPMQPLHCVQGYLAHYPPPSP